MSKKNTYLSIDLDFWNCYQEDVPQDFQYVFNKIQNHSIPFYICQDHREILRHTKLFPDFNVLVNIDAHQDLSDLMPRELCVKNFNCGTWVNFIPQRRNNGSQYLWLHPEGTTRGYYYYDPFKEPEKVGWNITKETSAIRLFLKDISFDEICGIGFSMSYDYIEWHITKAIKLLHDFSGKTFMNPIRKMRESHCIGFVDERIYNGDFEKFYDDKVFYRKRG